MDIKTTELINRGFSDYVLKTESHKHDSAQLSYTLEGILYVEIDMHLFIVPPNMAIFIPPNNEHKTNMQKVIKVENIYFNKKYYKLLPDTPQLINISDLAKQVILKICSSNKETTKTFKNLFMVLLEEINSGFKVDYAIKIPTDPKLLKIYFLFQNYEDGFPSLKEAAECACVNIRTLTRLFIRNTGLNFVTWKQQFIFIRALELLQYHKQVKFVAYKLGYNSESSFVKMFKKMSGGKTPSYFTHI